MKQVESLFIAEFAAQSSVTTLPEVNAVHLFEIRTCQRTLFLGFNTDDSVHQMLNIFSPRRFFKGADAYQFLLRFTCGLESEIKGETDVFGQTKSAVRDFLNNPKVSTPFAEEVHSLFLRVFEDTKEIRAEYLEGIGGNTYGALARRILGPKDDDRVLVVGAGQISKSVAPYFTEFQLKLWNRSPERLFTLKSELEQKSAYFIESLTGEEELKKSLKEASIVILATPAGSEIDRLAQTLCQNGQKILHLGGQASETSHFDHYPHFWSLTDLFLLEKEQSALREKQVHQAISACHHRALLRTLARSIHIAHGWEDLALFN